MRLQEQLCGDPCLRESDPRWYDVFFTTVYASHFLTGLTIAAVLWVRKREEWLLHVLLRGHQLRRLSATSSNTLNQ